MKKFKRNISNKLIFLSTFLIPILAQAKSGKEGSVAQGFGNVINYATGFKDTIFQLIYIFSLIYLGWQAFEAWQAEQWKQLMKQVGMFILLTALIWGGPVIFKAITGTNIDEKYKKISSKIINVDENKLKYQFMLEE